jgi:hypothetical protein
MQREKENENLQTKIATDQLLNEEANKQPEPILMAPIFFEEQLSLF